MSVAQSRCKPLLSLALSALLLSVSAVGDASAADIGFGFESTAAEESTSLAGLHPDFTTSFVLDNQLIEGQPRAKGRMKELSVALPPGLVGDPTQFPECTIGDFSAFANCPVASQLGVVKVKPSEFPEVVEPLYNLQPDRNEIARFGFYGFLYPIFIDISVRTAADYGVTATVHDASGQAALISAITTLWGVPADLNHDEQRLSAFEAVVGCPGTACLAPEGKRPSGLGPLPFLSNPSACEAQELDFTARTYQAAGRLFTGPPALLPATTGCANLRFEPSFQIEPTSHRAGAPTGLSAVLKIPQSDAASLPATSAMRAARVTLPEGITIASGAAQGLEACSDQQVGLGREVDSDCPNGAKLGTAKVLSPSLPEAIHGSIYQRVPEPGNIFRVWLVTDEFGLHLKIPGEIRPNPSTGRLTAEFKETPQLPVEEIDLEFKGGERAPLKNPDSCGVYATEFAFTPWSSSTPLTGEAQFEVTEGCNTGGFAPTLSAGTENPVAGAFSPFALTLKQESAEQNLAGLSITLPPGLSAKLAGVPLCPESSVPSGDCPASSQVGSAALALGPGPSPLWITQPGRSPTAVYLAGPYNGAPYSLLVKVPAQAGPFDLGSVLTRVALNINPETAQVRATSDPLPQILAGVPISYRTVHLGIDRGEFTLNPTNCEAMGIDGTATSSKGVNSALTDRFQVGECAALPFRPMLTLALKGATHRTANPPLIATLLTRPGEANIARVQVKLPPSAFLDNSHIRTVCTRPQFAADACPAGSIYGKASAASPLLDYPVSGPVYLRSNPEHELPDLVVKLKGPDSLPIEVDLVGRTDSVKGALRNTFEAVPDVPVSSFHLELFGGSRGLIEMSSGFCSRPRAVVKITGQNGRSHDTRPLVKSSCPRSTKRHQRRSRR